MKIIIDGLLKYIFLTFGIANIDSKIIAHNAYIHGDMPCRP